MLLLKKGCIIMSKNPKEIEFICLKCKTKERIPRDVVEFLDSADQIGVDTSDEFISASEEKIHLLNSFFFSKSEF